MELSRKIKEIREFKRIKQIEVAEALGIDVSNYAKIERKGDKITVDRLQAIAKALGVSVIDIFNWGEDKKDYQHTNEIKVDDNLSKKVSNLWYLVDRFDNAFIFWLMAFLDYLSERLQVGSRLDKGGILNGLGNYVYTDEDFEAILTYLIHNEYHNYKLLSSYSSTTLYRTAIDDRDPTFDVSEDEESKYSIGIHIITKIADFDRRIKKQLLKKE